MQTTLGVEALGVVQPAAVQAVAATRRGRVGVLGTPATVATGAYAAAIAATDPFVEVVSVSCGDLAHADRGGDDRRRARRRRARLLRAAARGRRRHRDPRLHALSARASRSSSGCSAPTWRSSPPGAPLARQVEHVLGTRGLDRPGTARATYGFLCTGDTATFRARARASCSCRSAPVEHVALGAARERLVGSPA